MSTDDLGPKPDAEIEPGEPNPGGPDARSDSDGVDTETATSDPVSRDLDPDSNPAVDEVLPEEMKQGEDTGTEATKSDTGETDLRAEDEDPA